MTSSPAARKREGVLPLFIAREIHAKTIDIDQCSTITSDAGKNLGFVDRRDEIGKIAKAAPTSRCSTACGKAAAPASCTGWRQPDRRRPMRHGWQPRWRNARYRPRSPPPSGRSARSASSKGQIRPVLRDIRTAAVGQQCHDCNIDGAHQRPALDLSCVVIVGARTGHAQLRDTPFHHRACHVIELRGRFPSARAMRRRPGPAPSPGQPTAVPRLPWQRLARFEPQPVYAEGARARRPARWAPLQLPPHPEQPPLPARSPQPAPDMPAPSRAQAASVGHRSKRRRGKRRPIPRGRWRIWFRCRVDRRVEDERQQVLIPGCACGAIGAASPRDTPAASNGRVS